MLFLFFLFRQPLLSNGKKSPTAFVTLDSLIFSDSFEADFNNDGKPDNWNLRGDISLDKNIAKAGASMKLIGQDKHRTLARSQPIQLLPHQSYRLSWWCKTESVIHYVSGSVRIGDRSMEFESEFQGGNFDWIYHEGIFTTLENDSSCFIVFQTGSGTAWIDEVKLEQYEKPLNSFEVINECAHILKREGDRAAIWFNYPATKIFRNDLLAPTLPQVDTIKIRLAKNEYEPFQLVLHPAQDLSSIKISVSDLNGPATISSELFTINTIHYVKIQDEWILNPDSRTGYYPDALPWSNLSPAPTNIHTPFWITIYAPTNIPAGKYFGRLNIRGSLNLEFPLQINVWDFSLPKIPRLEISASDAILFSPKIELYDLRSAEERFADFANNLINHRVLGCRYVAIQIHQQNWAQIIGDSLHLDFDILDQAIREYFDYGYLNFLLPPYSLAASGKPLGQTTWLDLIPLTDEFNTFFENYCDRLGSHLRKNGWINNGYMMLWDEPRESEYDDLFALFSIAKKGDPEIKLMLTEEPIPELYEVVDIWFPNLRRISLDQIYDRVENQIADGKVVGGYGNDRFSMLSPLTHQRLWAWTLKKYSFTKTGWWSVLGEGKDNSVWEDPVIKPAGSNYSSALYPGRAFFLYFDKEGDGPLVNSIRWEALREGAEDYEYLVELEKRLDNISPGSGDVVVQSFINSLVWDNIGETYEWSMQKVGTLRDSIGNRIESLNEPTGLTNETKYQYQITSNYLKISCAPNPFNSFTTISFDPAPKNVNSLKIYDVAGRVVRSYFFENQRNNKNSITWDGKNNYGNDVSSGVYIIRCQSETGCVNRRVVFLK